MITNRNFVGSASRNRRTTGLINIAKPPFSSLGKSRLALCTSALLIAVASVLHLWLSASSATEVLSFLAGGYVHLEASSGLRPLALVPGVVGAVGWLMLFSMLDPLHFWSRVSLIFVAFSSVAWDLAGAGVWNADRTFTVLTFSFTAAMGLLLAGAWMVALPRVGGQTLPRGIWAADILAVTFAASLIVSLLLSIEGSAPYGTRIALLLVVEAARAGAETVFAGALFFWGRSPNR